MRQASLASVQLSFEPSSHVEAAWERVLGVAVEARQRGANLIVLPALVSLLPLRSMAGRDWAFGAGMRDVLSVWAGPLEEMYMRWGRDLARALNTYVCPGTVLVSRGSDIKHMACLFSPGGLVAGTAYQAHVSPAEASWGWATEDEAPVIDTEIGRVGLLLGSDARMPEMGRILALQGADLFLSLQASDGPHQYWDQLAGTWAQVQGTQVYAVESHLVGRCGGRNLAGRSTIMGPCEVTAGQSGIVAQADQSDRDALVVATVDFQLLERIRDGYHIHGQLNPGFYGRHFPGIYMRGGKRR